jgi:protein-arginine kinase activator protein McsA
MLDLILGPAQQALAWIIGGAAVFLGVVLNTLRVKRKARLEGQEQAAEQARRLDHENAAAIRDRARAVKRVQPGDDLRYRD